MDTKEIIIETSLSKKEINEKLKKITITNFEELNKSPLSNYYGQITEDSFQIKNVRYSPMSPIPEINGEIIEEKGNTKLKIKMDLHSNFRLTRKMYFSTLLPIGVIVLLLSYLVLGGTKYQLQGFIFSAAFILIAFIIVAITKLSLVHMKKKELHLLAEQVNGTIKKESEIKLSNFILHPLMPLSQI